MANHTTSYIWLRNIVQLVKNKTKDSNWVQLQDDEHNRIVIYDDTDGKLFDAFCELCHNAEIEIE